jgi:hypothetical protein
MISIHKILMLPSLFGSQEIIVLLSLLFYIGIPVALITWFVGSINKINSQLSSIETGNSANEIEKLFMLKEKGAITRQAFDERKLKLLK